MKQLSFGRQIMAGMLLVAIGTALAIIFKNGIFSNISWILYGLLFVWNPVFPEGADAKIPQIGFVIRFLGMLVISMGIWTNFPV